MTPRRITALSALLLALVCFTSSVRAGDALMTRLSNLGAKFTVDSTQPGSPVVGIDTGVTLPRDEDLQGLGELKSLHTLRIASCWITAANIKEIAKLPNLRELTLLDTKITNEGLKSLRQITTLEVLRIGSSHTFHFDQRQITDAGIVALRELPKLKKLELDSTKITDDGLKELKALAMTLRSLNLSRTGITNAGLKQLMHLKNPEELDLSYTPITSDGFKDLKDLAKLQSLTVWGVKITPAGLIALAGHANLKRLTFGPKHMTDDVLKALRAGGLLHTVYYFTDHDYKPAASPANVHIVSLSTAPITDDALKELADLENLEMMSHNSNIVVFCSETVSAPFHTLDCPREHAGLFTGRQGGATSHAFIKNCWAPLAQEVLHPISNGGEHGGRSTEAAKEAGEEEREAQGETSPARQAEEHGAGRTIAASG